MICIWGNASICDVIFHLIKQALDINLEEVMHFFMKALDKEVTDAMLMVVKKWSYQAQDQYKWIILCQVEDGEGSTTGKEVEEHGWTAIGAEHYKWLVWFEIMLAFQTKKSYTLPARCCQSLRCTRTCVYCTLLQYPCFMWEEIMWSFCLLFGHNTTEKLKERIKEFYPSLDPAVEERRTCKAGRCLCNHQS